MATALLVSRSLAASTAPPLDSDLRMGFIVGSSLPSTMMKLTRPLIKSPDIKILPRFGITNTSVRPPKKPCAMRLASHSPLRAYRDDNHHNAIDTWRESPALSKGGRRRSIFLPGKLSGPVPPREGNYGKQRRMNCAHRRSKLRPVVGLKRKLSGSYTDWGGTTNSDALCALDSTALSSGIGSSCS